MTTAKESKKERSIKKQNALFKKAVYASYIIYIKFVKNKPMYKGGLVN